MIELAETVIDGIFKASNTHSISLQAKASIEIPTALIEPTRSAENILPYAWKQPFDHNIDEMQEVVEVYVPMWDYFAASPPNNSEPEFLGYWLVIHTHL